MIRDPFYNDIIEGLNKQLDPELFEQCACDILQSIYPTLVSFEGGLDSGRDGVIADIEGEPISLICTTQESVIENFTKSLKSHLRDGIESRKVVSVTSRKLSTKKKDNLKKRARELGFTLIQIHDQPDIANRLYGNTKWCNELLNITGNPPALSCYPLTGRPFIDIPLLGRESDLKWLNENDGDLLVIGQPGCGKTYLLWEYARRNKGLFVRNRNIGEIAKSYRDQKPEVIVVDDAQIYIDLISDILTLRQEHGWKYRLIANCWPFNRNKVLSAMHIPDDDNNVRKLKLLSRDTIVEVIHSCGIVGPDQLIHEIVNQSGGKPGLATTFCSLCKQGGIEDVVLGKTVKREIRRAFESMQEDVIFILGIISLGGDGGMNIDDISKITQKSKFDLQKILTALSAGGVLEVPNENQVIVVPEIIRCFFVKELFFNEIKCLRIEDCLPYVKNKSAALRVLVTAMHRDTNISQEFIRQMLESYGKAEDWRIYAWLGEREVKWITENHPEKVKEIVEPGLHIAPKVILPFLFEDAIGDERPLHSTLNHSLRQIQDWIKGAFRKEDKPVARRRILLDAILEWNSKGGDFDITLKALGDVLDPGFRTTRCNPGSGMQFTFTQGHLSKSEIGEIISLWPEIFEILKNSHIENWGPIKDIVHEWLHPYYGNISIPDSIRKLMKSFGKTILSDILTMCGEHQGVLHWIRSASKRCNLRINVELDKEFEMIFPTREFPRNWEKEEQKKEKNILKLVKEWKNKTPRCIINKLDEFEKYAKSANIFNYQRNLSYVYWKFSENTKNHNLWISIFLSSEKEHDSRQLYPFIMRMLDAKRGKWKELVNKLMSSKQYRFNTIQLILETNDLPSDITVQAIENASEVGEPLMYSYFRHHAPIQTLKGLLEHKDNKVAGYTAIGLWHGEPKGEICDEISELWRKAIVRFDDYDEYMLQEVLESNSELAFQWLEYNFDNIEEHVILMESNATVTSAIQKLTPSQKAKLLDKLENNYKYDDLARYIIGYDTSLYEKLLSKTDYRYLHLTVLKRERLNPALVPLMELAINSGYSEIDVARQLMSKSRSWSGRESDMWDKEISSYDLLINHQNPRIKKIGEMCIEYASGRKGRAENNEYYEDVFGR